MNDTTADKALVMVVMGVQKFADHYTEEYVLEGDSGTYTPNDQERMLITDAINGLIADEDFLRLVRTEVVELEKARAADNCCIKCGRRLPNHWGGCSGPTVSRE